MSISYTTIISTLLGAISAYILLGIFMPVIISIGSFVSDKIESFFSNL